MTHQHGKRLIYAADMSFVPGQTVQEMLSIAQTYLDRCCREFDGLGITLKGNTIFRLMGATAFTQLNEAGIDAFGDYKLFDVQSTCHNDGSWLRNIRNLEILTVAEDVHPKVFTQLQEMMPDVIIAPINPLTDLTDAEFRRRNEVDRNYAVEIFFERVMELPSKGVICSPKDLEHAPEGFAEGRTIITPGIRPLYTFVKDDTNAVNALTPTKAIKAGADRLVIGSPIRHDDQWRGNAERILDEIGEALAA